MNITYQNAEAIPESGNAITLANNSYVIEINDVRMDKCYNGIWIKRATESRLSKIQLSHMYGDYGIKFGGGGTEDGCYRAICDDILANNPYPMNYPANNAGNWKSNTAYSSNDIVFANGCIYQCVQSGKSSDSGGPSGNGGGFGKKITDGTAIWEFVCKQIVWVIQESNGFSLVLNKAALINGFVGFLQQNSSAPDKPPMWVFGNDIECDHSYYANVQLAGGEGAYLNNCWFGSCLAGNAVNIIPPYSGQVSLMNSRISFAATNGICIGAADDDTGNPKDIIIQGNFIGGNGQAKFNTYHGIVAGGETTNLSIIGNKIGTDIANSALTQNTGIFIYPSVTQCIVTNNNLTGNVASPMVFDYTINSIAKDNLSCSHSLSPSTDNNLFLYATGTEVSLALGAPGAPPPIWIIEKSPKMNAYTIISPNIPSSLYLQHGKEDGTVILDAVSSSVWKMKKQANNRDIVTIQCVGHDGHSYGYLNYVKSKKTVNLTKDSAKDSAKWKITMDGF
jgi:hypothetical protein